MRFPLIFAIACFAVTFPAKAQTADWRLAVAHCVGGSAQVSSQNQFGTDLSGNPNVIINETTQRSGACVVTVYGTQFQTGPDCTQVAAPLEQAYDGVNQLGHIMHTVQCQPKGHMCDWLLTTYTDPPQTFRDWHAANCQGT